MDTVCRRKLKVKSFRFLLLLLLFIAIAAPQVRGLTDIVTLTCLSPGTPETNQKNPAIWEDRVVWEDQDMASIVLYNVTSGIETRLTGLESAARIPAISGNLVAWENWTGDNFDIELLNLNTGQYTFITKGPADHVNPALWGENVVYEDHSLDNTSIGWYNARTGEEKLISPANASSTNPAIWGYIVVWLEEQGDTQQIMGYNLSSGSGFRVTNGTTKVQKPSVYADMVVWSEYQGYLQVRLANITSGLVTSLTSAASDHYNPVIFGDLVAYEEQGNYNRITLLDIATRKEMVISPARPDTDQDQPAVWEDRVVWRESREGFYDIYLATLGVSKPPLHVDFSVNTSEGHAPLPVLFTPNTTGEVTGYTWDFGDGDRSSERSPVHTYEIPGIYSPALTVNNPCQREKLTKSGFITIGSPPATMFSANATYGPAPLDVAFVDSSSGNPDAWSWDFGDGSNSTLQNPVHRYPAGNYSVSLTASSRWGTTTVTREDYIHALEVSRYMGRFPGEGITIKPLGGGLHLLLDTGKFLSFAIYQVDNTTVLDVVPPMDTGFSRMVFHSSDGTGFRETGYGTVEGNISGVAAISSDQAGGVVPGQFPWFYNLTQVIPGYPYGGSIGAVLWQNCTPGDLQRFDDTAMRNDYGVARVAYTLACTEEGIENASPASLQFGLDPDWIARNGWRWPVYVQSDPAGAEAFVDSRYVGVTPLYVDEGLATGEHNLTLRYNGYNNATTVFVVGDLKDSIAVLRIADDGSGSLLPDNYLGYDAARGLEIFEAESPGGLSRFGVVSLYQTGNPIQLLYLTLQMLTRGSIVSSGSVSTTGGGGGGGGGGGSIGGAAVSATPIPVATEVPSLEAVLPAATTEQPLREKVQAQAAPPAPQGTTGPTAAIPQSAAEYGSYTLVLVKNLAVVFVAVLVAVLLYLRWRKGGSGV